MREAPKRRSGHFMEDCGPAPFEEESFSDYVGRAATSTGIPPSPLFHVTTTGQLKEILKAGSISPIFCESMDQDLVYTFYGRPAYRPRIKVDQDVPAEVQPSEDQELVNPLLFPMCIALKPNLAENAHAFFPFDTGAFVSKRYSRYIGIPSEANERRNRCHDFELRREHDTPNKFVSCFYGTNLDYFRLFAVANLLNDTNSDDVKAYHDLIRSDSLSPELDDRRGALEVQFKDPIPIDSNNVEFVVLPTAKAIQENYARFFADRGIEIRPYLDTKGKFTEHRAAMVNEVYAAMRQRGIIEVPARRIARRSS